MRIDLPEANANNARSGLLTSIRYPERALERFLRVISEYNQSAKFESSLYQKPFETEAISATINELITILESKNIKDPTDLQHRRNSSAFLELLSTHGGWSALAICLLSYTAHELSTMKYDNAEIIHLLNYSKCGGRAVSPISESLRRQLEERKDPDTERRIWKYIAGSQGMMQSGESGPFVAIARRSTSNLGKRLRPSGGSRTASL